MLWITAKEIKLFTGVTPDSFGLEEDQEAEMDEMITNFIEEAMSIIAAYCAFKTTEIVGLPLAVKTACRMLVMNMIAFHMSRSNTRLMRGKDHESAITDDSIFTKAIKDILAPFIQAGGGGGGDDPVDKPSKRYKLRTIAITGDD